MECPRPIIATASRRRIPAKCGVFPDPGAVTAADDGDGDAAAVLDCNDAAVDDGCGRAEPVYGPAADGGPVVDGSIDARRQSIHDSGTDAAHWQPLPIQYAHGRRHATRTPAIAQQRWQSI